MSQSNSTNVWGRNGKCKIRKSNTRRAVITIVSGISPVYEREWKIRKKWQRSPFASMPSSLSKNISTQSVLRNIP